MKGRKMKGKIHYYERETSDDDEIHMEEDVESILDSPTEEE